MVIPTVEVLWAEDETARDEVLPRDVETGLSGDVVDAVLVGDEVVEALKQLDQELVEVTGNHVLVLPPGHDGHPTVTVCSRVTTTVVQASVDVV